MTTLSKKEFSDSVKAPDAFLSTSAQAVQWIEAHGRMVATVVAAGSFIGLAYVGYTYWQSKLEARAAEQIYNHEGELKKAEGKIRDERAKKMQEMAGLSAKSGAGKSQVPPADFGKDYGSIVEQLKTDLKANAGTNVAMISALNLSYFLLQQQQFAQALEVLKIPTSSPAKGDLLGGFWRMHYGLVLLENSKANEAMAFYNEVLGTSNLKPFHSEAMLKLGIAYELLGDQAKAKETYEKLGREFPNSEASGSATQFLRLLELKSKQG